MTTEVHSRDIGGRRVDYQIRLSPTAKKLRVRVGINGVEVVQPLGRSSEDINAFLDGNAAWLHQQLDRMAKLQSVKRLGATPSGQILLRGTWTEIVVQEKPSRIRSNLIRLDEGKLIVVRGRESRTPAATSLENWLRRLARGAIQRHVDSIVPRLKVQPGRIYVMGQRTKWGNCSARQNLSFNWRIVLAPDFVLRYLVTHELAHLAVPDHSHRFWLTVQSICQDAERARAWLSANSSHLMVDLHGALFVAERTTNRAHAPQAPARSLNNARGLSPNAWNHPSGG